MPAISWRLTGAIGGENGADASAPPPSRALPCTQSLPYTPERFSEKSAASTARVSARAEKVCCVAGTGAHVLPRLYCTCEARVLPEPSVRLANLTSTARLNSRTADPFLGGTKLAAIASTAVGLLGGQVSLITTTSGPGVRGIFVVSSVAPDAWSLIVIVPKPPWNTVTQSLNCEKR